MSSHFLIAIKKQHRLLVIGGAAILLEIFLSLMFIKHGLGITGIAIAAAVVYFIYNTLVVGYACRHFQKKWRDTISFFLKIYFPFLYFTPLVIILHKLGHLTGPWTVDIAIIIGRMAGLVLVSVPFLIYLEKKYSLFKGLKRAVCRK